MGKTERKWHWKPILAVLGTSATSHLAGGGRYPAWCPEIPPWFPQPTARPLTAVKAELTDLQNISEGSFSLSVATARIINTNVKQDTDIAAWKM